MLSQQPLGEHPGRLHELRSIHQHEGVQRRVGGVALGHTGHPLGHVKTLQHRPRSGPSPEGVEAAAVERVSRIRRLRLE